MLIIRHKIVKKNNTMIIIVKKQRMLKINEIVKSVCFQVIHIHSPVNGFFHTYQWEP